MPGTKVPVKEVEVIIKLYNIGLSKTHIAKRSGLSRQTITAVIKDQNKYLKLKT